jgi:hypothetical protein
VETSFLAMMSCARTVPDKRSGLERPFLTTGFRHAVGTVLSS